MKLIPPRGELLLPLTSGLLLAISFPPARLIVPPFVALVPLLIFVAGQPDTPTGRWAAARGAFVTGVVYFGVLLYWLVVALIHYSLLAIPAYVLTVTAAALIVASMVWGLHYTIKRTPLALPLAAALFWTTHEWIQGNLGDLAFPWLGLGSSLAYFPRLAGAADLVGARGLTFWLALVNGLIALGILHRRENRPVRGIALGVLVAIALPVAYGFVRTATIELQPAAEVAVVQPNIPEELKMDRDQALDSSLTALVNLNERIDRPVDLVVWPEVALPALLAHPSQAWLSRRVRSLSEEAGAPFVVGAYGMEEDERRVFFNSAFVVAPAGIIEEPYHKQYLVPFVERIPFINPALLEAVVGSVQYFGGLGRGAGAIPMGATGQEYGILICYESIFAPLARRYRLNGADFLVNITNDAWYGRDVWWGRTSALWQHPAHLRMRAIENRVGIARAANTGISMFVDPLGRTYQRTQLFEPDLRIATVYTTDEITLYTRWGDWVSVLALLGAMLALGWGRVRSARRPGTDAVRRDVPQRVDGSRTPR